MNTFQGTERLIYEFIIHHADQLKDISAKQVATSTHSNTTSVNRVCKKMGYASYTEIRYKLPIDKAEKDATKEAKDQLNPALPKFVRDPTPSLPCLSLRQGSLAGQY